MSKPKIVTFHCSKDHFRRLELERNGKKFTICHAYPTLAHYMAGQIPDDVNPRTHKDNILTKKIPGKIRETLIETPQDFVLANRGASVIAEKVSFDPDKEQITVILSSYEDRSFAIHGMADGATSDATIKEVQEALLKGEGKVGKQIIPAGMDINILKEAQFHLEIICGDFDRDDILIISRGRNTSEAVKDWTLASHGGKFQWLEAMLQSGKFRDKVGPEENSGKSVDIREVIARLATCHPDFEQPNAAPPIIAYNARGSMHETFLEGEEGFRQLSPLIEDILTLSEEISASFEQKKKKLPLRIGAWEDALGEKVFPRSRKEKILPLTGKKTNMPLNSAFLMPLLASFRALIDFGNPKKARWKTDPFAFWDKHGSEIVGAFLRNYAENGKTPNHYGRKEGSYVNVYDKVNTLYMREKMHEMEAAMV